MSTKSFLRLELWGCTNYLTVRITGSGPSWPSWKPVKCTVMRYEQFFQQKQTRQIQSITAPACWKCWKCPNSHNNFLNKAYFVRFCYILSPFSEFVTKKTKKQKKLHGPPGVKFRNKSSPFLLSLSAQHLPPVWTTAEPVLPVLPVPGWTGEWGPSLQRPCMFPAL